jgi:hypothetical protein
MYETALTSFTIKKTRLDKKWYLGWTVLYKIKYFVTYLCFKQSRVNGPFKNWTGNCLVKDH